MKRCWIYSFSIQNLRVSFRKCISYYLIILYFRNKTSGIFENSSSVKTFQWRSKNNFLPNNISSFTRCLQVKEYFTHHQSRKANIIMLIRLLKRVGGHWVVGDPDYGQHRAVDGDKFVCLDQILEQDQCVIYSFGISSDWTFEDQMDELGTFTHTIWV